MKSIINDIIAYVIMVGFIFMLKLFPISGRKISLSEVFFAPLITIIMAELIYYIWVRLKTRNANKDIKK
jgi:cytochrome c biogenesis factor